MSLTAAATVICCRVMISAIVSFTRAVYGTDLLMQFAAIRDANAVIADEEVAGQAAL